MGRYTTVQTFTDQDAKVAVSYGAGKGDAESGGATGGAGPNATSDVASGGGARATDGDDRGGDKYRVNRVDNVSGSSAGAGSGDFHMYRAARRRELERVSRMEQEFEKKKEMDEFERTRKRNMEEFEARAQKRAEKRRRRKDRAMARSMDDASAELNGNGDRTQGQDKSVEQQEPQDEKALPEMPGGVPEIANDGSFLARMLAMQNATQEETATPATSEDTTTTSTMKKRVASSKKTASDKKGASGKKTASKKGKKVTQT